jgi:hypothetical protein
MRRPTPSFTVEPESRRKSAQGFAPDEDQLIDEPAPEEVPSRDVNEDAPVSGVDDTPPTTVSVGDSASSTLAPQQNEPSEPSPTAPDESLEGERTSPAPVPASASEDTWPENRDGLLTEPAPKRRRTPARSSARPERVPDRDEQAARSTRPAMVLEEQVSVAEPSAPAQEEHPAPVPKLTRRRTEPRVPAGERWKRRRLPKVCW